MGFIKGIKEAWAEGAAQGEAQAAIARKESGCRIAASLAVSLSGLAESFDDSGAIIDGSDAPREIFAGFSDVIDSIFDEQVDVCQTTLRETGCMAQLSVVAKETGRQVVVNCVCPKYA